MPRPPNTTLLPYTTLFRSFTRNYIQRKKKALIPTEKGLQVYELVKDRKIADVGMTAEWEMALHNIENNEADRKSTRLNSSHVKISYAVFCLKKKNNSHIRT